MNGILLVDKLSGWSSFDVVAKVRGILREAQRAEVARLSHEDGVAEPLTQQSASSTAGVAGSASQQSNAVRKIRVGHTGTLDPLATGLMIVVVGTYCKRAEEFSKLDKTYEVTMKLGETSTTGDEEGEKTTTNAQQPDEREVKEVLSSFVGESMQVPPAFSAIKVDGKRAYKLAREGKEVKIEPRKIRINSLELTNYSYPEIAFTVDVSSGTYIRSLVQDIGEKLGTGAYMSDLRRTKVGAWNIEDAVVVEKSTSYTDIAGRIQAVNPT